MKLRDIIESLTGKNLEDMIRGKPKEAPTDHKGTREHFIDLGQRMFKDWNRNKPYTKEHLEELHKHFPHPKVEDDVTGAFEDYAVGGFHKGDLAERLGKAHKGLRK